MVRAEQTVTTKRVGSGRTNGLRLTFVTSGNFSDDSDVVLQNPKGLTKREVKAAVRDGQYSDLMAYVSEADRRGVECGRYRRFVHFLQRVVASNGPGGDPLNEEVARWLREPDTTLHLGV